MYFIKSKSYSFNRISMSAESFKTACNLMRLERLQPQPVESISQFILWSISSLILCLSFIIITGLSKYLIYQSIIILINYTVCWEFWIILTICWIIFKQHWINVFRQFGLHCFLLKIWSFYLDDFLNWK